MGSKESAPGTDPMDISQAEFQALPHHQPLVSVLPGELLVHIVGYLTLPSIGLFGQSCRAANAAATRPGLWVNLLQRFYPDVGQAAASPMAGPSPRARFLTLAYAQQASANRHVRTHRDGTRVPPACPCLPSCGGTLLAPTGGARCPCVAARTSSFTLTLGQLGRARTGSSSLRSGGFSELHSLLRDHFTVRHEDLCTLSPEALRGVDALVLCTTEGPALAPDEVHALQGWVQEGGALIVSAFSNWSRHGHFAAETVGWLGIRTIAGAEFLPRHSHTFRQDVTACAETARLCGASGPFAVAASGQFVNTGESVFCITEEGFAGGAVKLCDLHPAAPATLNFMMPTEGLTTLCFYPPGSPAAQKGRVLVCSNYHWLADACYWNGGTLQRGDNARLLLNFLAGAVAARVNPSRTEL